MITAPDTVDSKWKKTPLYDLHTRLGAQIVIYEGWLLPLEYVGITKEHRAVREHAGLFDVSHMGRIRIDGPDAGTFLDLLLPRTVSTLTAGHAIYSPMCAADGGTVDDLMVQRFSDGSFLLIINASNHDTDLEHIFSLTDGYDLQITDITQDTAMLALQGPDAPAILLRAGCDGAAELDFFAFLESVKMAGYPCTVSRSGYTGEDGFEIVLPVEGAVALWRALQYPGAELPDTQPCGLGARDTLRFEAGLPLYGNELSRDISPLEAGLTRFIDWDKPDFIGKEALYRQRADGIPRTLIGFEITDRGIARKGYPVFAENHPDPIGFVTTGYPSPTLMKSLGMALVDTKWAGKSRLKVKIREKTVTVSIRSRFFYRRKGR